MLSRRAFHTLLMSTTAVAATGMFGRSSAVAADPPTKGAFPVTKTPEEWKKTLNKEQFYVLREHGTERAFSSPLDKISTAGVYKCAGCTAQLFESDTKFDSGTGWPSFWKPIDKAIGTTVDRKFFMTRTEVHFATCGGHLGHVFEDGPKPTGLRYCMNGVAMTFEPKADKTATSKS